MSFVVYRSSAGSGKTFTLVLQYIRLLLEDPGRFRNILAITFTNKAAAEMKQRIVLGLAGLAAGKQDSLYDQLALQGFEPSLIRTRASIALRKILHEYDDLAVGTIDSFMHRVVRTFARDMHIPAGFEVQLDLGELSALVVDLLLDKVGNDDPVTRVMQDFMSFRIGEEGSARLDDELSDYVQILLKEEARERMDSLRSWNIEDYIQLAASLKARIRERNTRLQDLVRQALRCIESYGLTDQDVIRKTSGLLAYFR
ncbi:MAG: UvrD-helicase domain-containing protein, partial [Bacteroidales bacterium]|nr:UvrD-helicase domain-containing protein [Bacteroidales bacterium]